MKLNAKLIVNMAMLIALSIILKRFMTIPLPIGILNFGGFPIIFAGFFLGPYAGAITGILSDITGYIAFPRGPYIPIFTISDKYAFDDTSSIFGKNNIILFGSNSLAIFWILLVLVNSFILVASNIILLK